MNNPLVILAGILVCSMLPYRYLLSIVSYNDIDNNSIKDKIKFI